MDWKVKIDDNYENELERLIDSGKLSSDDFVVIRQWIGFVEKNGPESLQNNGFWNDHELIRDEKWKGCRSSSFGYSGRIIYKIVEKKILVLVLRITTDHNYK